jgi:hypothetical protein
VVNNVCAAEPNSSSPVSDNAKYVVKVVGSLSYLMFSVIFMKWRRTVEFPQENSVTVVAESFFIIYLA